MEKEKIEISNDIQDNINYLNATFYDCNDIVKREINIGEKLDISIFIMYIDLMVDRNLIESTVVDTLIIWLKETVRYVNDKNQDLFKIIVNAGLTTVDFKVSDDLNELKNAVLSGDTIVLVENSTSAIIVSTKGWPNRGIQSAENEVVLQGSKEAFSEVFRFNSVLIRRRIKDERLKIQQFKVGTRSQTDVGVMYMDDIVDKEVLYGVIEKIKDINIDAIYDTGYIEQFIEKEKSPFPQMQITERPDKASSALLEGRIVVIVDNSPVVLIVPATLNLFFQASDDYYQRNGIASFVRLIRFGAGIMSLTLPGLYLAISIFHTSMISMDLVFKMAGARENVPFPPLSEILMMELAFELLREAGIRLPAPIGSTIGIVGGIIIGQSAVEAGLVSPIVVIIVALTAIASFAIPNTSFGSAIRVCKYGVTIASAYLGFLGFWLAIICILIHLASLKSFGVPYLFPYAGGEVNGYTDYKDSFVRMPFNYMRKRPLFANKKQKNRMG